MYMYPSNTHSFNSFAVIMPKFGQNGSPLRPISIGIPKIVKLPKFAKICKKMGPHSFFWGLWGGVKMVILGVPPPPPPPPPPKLQIFKPSAESPGGKHLIPRTPRPHRLLVPFFFYPQKRPHSPPSGPEIFFIPASQIFEKWLTNSRNEGGDQSQVLFFPSSAQQFEWRRRKKSNKQAFI